MEYFECRHPQPHIIYNMSLLSREVHPFNFIHGPQLLYNNVTHYLTTTKFKITLQHESHWLNNFHIQQQPNIRQQNNNSDHHQKRFLSRDEIRKDKEQSNTHPVHKEKTLPLEINKLA